MQPLWSFTDLVSSNKLNSDLGVVSVLLSFSRRVKMESRQTELLVLLFVTFAAAMIITILRLLSRTIKRNPLSWDDYFALCGFVCDCCYHITSCKR
jgi:hypothetical protein